MRAMSEPDPTLQLPRNTTPTWEVELLISGVAVFAMLQLPGQLDDAMLTLEPRLGADWRRLAILTYVYAKSASLILAVTFVLHLLLRARWIALVGVHSVHTDGIRWDKLKLGPILREIELAQAQPFPKIIERADNRATTVFAIGVMQALLMVAVAATACGVFAVAVALASTTKLLSVEGWLIAIFAFVMLPYLLAVWLDHLCGARWPAEHRLRRGLHAVLKGYARIGFGRNSNPIMALLASHDGDRKTVILTTGLMLLALLGAVAGMAAMTYPERFGSYSMFPRPDQMSAVIDPAHYDDQRDPLRDGADPYIQSSVVVGPYLKLVVPYRPNRDDPAMRTQCAQAAGLEAGALASARLDCLQSLHGVTLDGTPLADLPYEIAMDPRSDRPALLAMIDVRNLTPGRHELRIARPARSDRKPDKDNPDPGFDSIAFWR